MSQKLISEENRSSTCEPYETNSNPIIESNDYGLRNPTIQKQFRLKNAPFTAARANVSL